MTAREFQKVLDAFKVRCFHVAYRTLHDIRDNSIRFAEAIARTSDIVLDIAKPEVREGFHKWYYGFWAKKWESRRKNGKINFQ